jgi:hypothetical protein
VIFFGPADLGQECDKAAEQLTHAGPGKCVALSSANISTEGACVPRCGLAAPRWALAPMDAQAL